MKGASILINGNQPNGRFLEGIIYGTPAPGTVMEKVPGVELQNGRYTYRAVQTGANGDRRPQYVLLEDASQGVVADINGANTYTSGRWGFLYVPLPGDELNMLFKNIAGTGDKFAIGDKAMVDAATGKLIAGTGSAVSQPYEVGETVSAITADTLIAVMYT